MNAHGCGAIAVRGVHVGFSEIFFMAVNFYLDNREDRNGEVSIRVSVALGGARVVTSTGLKLKRSQWNVAKGEPKRGVFNAAGVSWAQMLQFFNRIREHFSRIEAQCITEGLSVSTDVLRTEMRSVLGRKDASRGDGASGGTGFWDRFAQFCEERGAANAWTRSTFQKMAALKMHVMTWQKDVTFESFSESGLTDFVRSLREVEGLKNSTIGKQMGFLKWFLRWATQKGYNKEMAYQVFSPKLKVAANTVVFLSRAELRRVMEYEVPPVGTVVDLESHDGRKYQKIIEHREGLMETRDVFCFCCFTSLRFSDAHNLKRANIHGDSMTLTTVKTADTITIELNKHALAILERYKDSDFGGYALPRITNQRMNIYLKDICELCGINEPVTKTYYSGSRRIDETRPKFAYVGTHTARRTFICNAISMGIPVEIIMKWTGHADYKSMKPYIDVMGADKRSAMDLFNDI